MATERQWVSSFIEKMGQRINKTPAEREHGHWDTNLNGLASQSPQPCYSLNIRWGQHQELLSNEYSNRAGQAAVLPARGCDARTCLKLLAFLMDKHLSTSRRNNEEPLHEPLRWAIWEHARAAQGTYPRGTTAICCLLPVETS